MSPIEPLPEFTLFATAVGRCGIVWGAHGIRAVQLPEADERRTRGRILRAVPQARPGRPPPVVRRVIDDLVALLAGKPRTLRAAVLDERRLSEFQRRVYQITRAIDPGRTLSYGEVAELCGDRSAARAVGQALGHNPFPLIVPCHRVLAAHGRSGGFSSHGGVATKLHLLCLEGWPAPAPAAAPASSTVSAAIAAGNLPLPF
jgi:methylated-DNA-[protein]-cysteine S-methyltransferase